MQTQTATDVTAPIATRLAELLRLALETLDVRPAAMHPSFRKDIVAALAEHDATQ